MSVASSIDYHQTKGHISLDQHVKGCVVELGCFLDSRTAIYLDTNFWILLRKAALGLDSNDTNLELLRLLRKGVTDRKLFCPISESVFLELLKQSDLSSRLATARLIDELSLGVTLLHNQARFSTELGHFIHSLQAGASLHPLDHLMWSKLSYVLGFLHPTSTVFDANTELVIQKAFFDHMWTIPLAKMVEMIGKVPGAEDLRLDDIATTLNAGAKSHASEIRSFEQAWRDELRGVADLCADMAVEVISHIAEQNGGPPILHDTPQWKQCRSMCGNLLFHTLSSKPEARQQLPSLYVEACLHAAFRWDKSRRFKGNDIYDFNHASAALAYCDAFFTEHPLRTLIASNNIALDRLYGCHVVSNVSEATAFLKTLKLDDEESYPNRTRQQT
ncbi:MAG: hypothetical protein JWR80_7156 [Bradyrhizobium sp.]|nr:hypothetical protein [Bradyrhizobium sp.]